MTLHCLGFPHTRLDGGFETCAYTQKVRKFALLPLDCGDVLTYGPGGDVELLDEAERLHLFGADDANAMPQWPSAEQWQLFNACAIKEVAERATAGDLLLCFGGASQQLVADTAAAFAPGLIACEPGVGYEGIFASFCAFESYAWMHHVYAKTGIPDGRWFDRVIPNYFDPSEFPHLNDGDGAYLLFVGRVTPRKGLQAAIDIADAVGMRLVVAGPQAASNAVDTMELPEWVEELGPVNAEERALLMAGAACLLAPTTYVEPFGGVAIEAMMCGTPVIATDWGAFTETVTPGVSGYRFRTLAEAIVAVEAACELDPILVRAYALNRYSLEAVAPAYRAWFEALNSLRGDGWYARQAPQLTSN